MLFVVCVVHFAFVEVVVCFSLCWLSLLLCDFCCGAVMPLRSGNSLCILAVCR